MVQLRSNEVICKVLHTHQNTITYGRRAFALLECTETHQRILMEVSKFDYKYLNDHIGDIFKFKTKIFGHRGELVSKVPLTTHNRDVNPYGKVIFGTLVQDTINQRRNISNDMKRGR